MLRHAPQRPPNQSAATLAQEVGHDPAALGARLKRGAGSRSRRGVGHNKGAAEAFWERTEKPPRSDVLPKLADVLGVRIEELLDVQAPSGRRAPAASQAKRLFDEVQKLPRHQQQKVLDVVSAIVEQFKRKAS